MIDSMDAMTNKRTFITWLTGSLVGAIALAGVAGSFGSSVVTSAAPAKMSAVLGQAGSLQNPAPCSGYALSNLV
jgi:hypothetical protein